MASSRTASSGPGACRCGSHEIPETGRSVELAADDADARGGRHGRRGRGAAAARGQFDLTARPRRPAGQRARLGDRRQTCVVTLEPMATRSTRRSILVFAPPRAAAAAAERRRPGGCDRRRAAGGAATGRGRSRRARDRVPASRHRSLSAQARAVFDARRPAIRRAIRSPRWPRCQKGHCQAANRFRATAPLLCPPRRHAIVRRAGAGPLRRTRPQPPRSSCPRRSASRSTPWGAIMARRWSCPGADLSLARHPDSEFILFGDRGQDRAAARRAIRGSRPAPRLVHTDVAVRMDDKPSQALRNGRWKSSMWLAIDAVKKGEADVAVSAGNTGALMAMAKFNLQDHARHRAPGDRGALADAARASRSCSISAPSIGADAEHLVDMAVMGSAMARVLFDLDRPTRRAAQHRRRGGQGPRAGARGRPHPARGRVAAYRLCRLRRGRRHRQGHGRRGGDRGLCRQYRAQDRGRHRAPVRRLSAQRDESQSLARQARLSAGARRVQHAAREDGPAQGQRRRVPRPQRRRDQEPRRHRRRKASPPRSTWATTWCATNCSPRSAQTLAPPCARAPAAAGASAERPRDRAAFGRAGLRQLSAGARPHQRTSWPRRSTPPTSGSCSAPASASAISRRRASSPPTSAIAGGARGARRRQASMPQSIDLIVLGDLDARQHLSGHRGDGAGRARHHPRRGLRSAGGVLGLRLRARDRRRPAAHRHATSARW